jgi:hypothetical protein
MLMTQYNDRLKFQMRSKDDHGSVSGLNMKGSVRSLFYDNSQNSPSLENDKTHRKTQSKLFIIKDMLPAVYEPG